MSVFRMRIGYPCPQKGPAPRRRTALRPYRGRAIPAVAIRRPIQSGHPRRSSQAQNSCPLERSAGTDPRRQTLGGALGRNLRRSSLQVAKALRPSMLTGMFRRKIASNAPTRNGIRFPAYVLFSGNHRRNRSSPSSARRTESSVRRRFRTFALIRIHRPPFFCKHKTYIIRFYGTY